MHQRVADCCNVSKMMPPSCQALLQGKKHGFMVTTEQMSSLERCRRHLGRRKRGMSGQKSRKCWSFPLTWRMCCITNPFLKARTWSRLPTGPFCNAFKVKFVGNGLINDLTVPGSCTMTRRHASRPWVLENSWPSTSSQWLPIRLACQFWPPATSSWTAWKGKDFKTSWRYSGIPYGGCRPFQDRPTTHAMKSGRIAGIAA